MTSTPAPKTVLTGIKPTGNPHIGNLLGAIRPALALSADTSLRSLFFIADYHALTATHDRAKLQAMTLEVAATWLAFGLDPGHTTFYRQSDVPEIFELAWVLSCFCPKGFMNKAHAYKAATDRNRDAGEPEDAGVGMGLYTYPVLMAADILIVDADLVPVGKDQVQHVEIARDIAQRINHHYGADALRLPGHSLRAQTAIVPGLDGRKMSKSYGNTLPCFLPTKKLRKTVMRIKTDSTPPEEPKNPDDSVVFGIHRALLDADAEKTLAAEYRSGISWGGAKQLLFEELERHLAEPRARYEELMANKPLLDEILESGASKAREVSVPVLARVRDAIGIARR